MQPGDNIYRDAVVQFSELAGEQGVLEGCDLKGPAVIVPQDSNFASSRLVGNPNALLWEISSNRTKVIGATLIRNCTFMNVGFAGPAEFVEQVRQSLGSS